MQNESSAIQAERPVAVVFNNFLKTAGGGERSSLDYAAAFCDLGYQVIFAVDHQVGMTLDQATAPFGITLPGHCELREFNGIGELLHFVRTAGCEVFLNHTYCSFVVNYAPIGLYAAMFPTHIGPAEVANLRTYSRILCISEFTRQYVGLRWSDDLLLETLCPPISKTHSHSSDDSSFEMKERLILNIGRFNVFGHNKNQLEAIKSFTRAVDRGIFDRDWKLRVIGQVNNGAETLAYVDACQQAAKGYRVEICLNAPLSLLQESYRRASYLWQFTGYGLEFGLQPERCEHLGLVALDGFAYGVLPVVYERGGAALLLRHGRDGFVFWSQDDLDGICSEMAKSFGSVLHRYRFETALTRIEDFYFEGFKNQLGEHLSQIKKGDSHRRTGKKEELSAVA